MNTADRYAEYVYQAKYDDFPTAVIEKAKELILDSVGCALGALQTEDGQANVKYAQGLNGKSESTVIGGGMRISQTKAAFVNAQLANLLDFDDTYDIYGPGHPGCLIVPAALAVGEGVSASGKEVLAAVILAYEVTMRVGRATGSILWKVGGPGLSSPIGPAVAAAKLLGMDEGTIRNTLDVLTLESGLNLAPPSRGKWDIAPDMTLGNLKGNYGQGAELGILAALKAQSGLTGIKGLLDLDFTQWYLAGLPAEGYDYLTQGLGEEHWIVDMSFKPTPSCRWTHVPITAAWSALDGQPVKAEDVSKVVVRGVSRLQRYEWETMLDAQFSIPCTLALAMVGETPGPGWYTTGRFKDQDIRDLAGKVEFERDPEAEALEIREVKMTCTVEITLESGEVKTGRCEHVKGAPGNPLTRDELVAKFRANASQVDEGQAKALIDVLLNLEAMDNVAALMEMLDTV